MSETINGFEILFPPMDAEPISTAIPTNVPAPGLTGIELQPSNGRIAISTADDAMRDRHRDQRRNRHYGPTYMFSIAQKPFILSSSAAVGTSFSVSPVQFSANTCSRIMRSTIAESERSIAQDVNPLVLPPAASPGLAKPISRASVGDSNSDVRHTANLQNDMYEPNEGLHNLEGISRHFSNTEMSPGAGCVESDVVGSTTYDVPLQADHESNAEVDLHCHEKFDKDDDLFHILSGALPPSNLAAGCVEANDVTFSRHTTVAIDRELVAEEAEERLPYGVWRKLRQSKVVAKWWWHLGTEHWRGRSEGGIYVNGELTCAKQESEKPESEEGSNGKAGQRDNEEKTGIDQKRKPSRFCHICLRKAERVTAIACHNLYTGRCRKVICKRCFDEYDWDWGQAIARGSRWACPHCQKECPERAQCFNYSRTNSKRHVALMKRKAELHHKPECKSNKQESESSEEQVLRTKTAQVKPATSKSWLNTKRQWD